MRLGRRRAVVLATLLALPLSSVGGVDRASGVEAGPPFVPGELIIAFERGVADAQIVDFHADFNLRIDEDLDADPRDRDPEETLTDVPAVTDALIARVESDPRVEYAEPNYLVSVVAAPNDPDYGRLWGLHNTGQTGGTPDADIDAPEAWDISTGSPDFVVGVIDSGVNYAHADLAENMWVNPGEIAGNAIDDDGNGYVDDIHGINAIADSGDPADDYGHGTLIAGTIAAARNNATGVAGVAPSARIAACKFITSSNTGTIADAIQCVKYFNALKNRAVNPVNVVATNNSWGLDGFSQAMHDALLGLDQPGMPPILHVCAAGNGNADNDSRAFYPSSYPIDNIVAVAATDHNDRYASYSNWGATTVDLAAPGTSIYTTYIPGNSYLSANGTSLATPHVAGGAVLVKALNPSFSAGDLKQRLLASVDPIGGLSGNVAKPTLTNGRLNVLRALKTDVTAPAAATIAVSRPTSSSVTLNWTATGDDGTDGTASAYDVRYSTSSISDDTWSSATRAIGEPAPREAGSTETFTVGGLAPSTSYHFAVKVADTLGNESVLSNVAVTTTADAPKVLRVTDGWDQRANRTMVRSGTVSTVGSSDNNRVSVNRGYLWAFQFQDPALPADATVHSVTIHVEHHEESGFSGSVAWQVHTGSLTDSNPVPLQGLNAPIRIGSGNERTDAWDVSTAIDQSAEVAAMKLVIRNNGTTSARTRIDRVWADVSYSTGPDRAAPDTTVVLGPSGRVNSTSARFTYSSSEAGSTFACRLNGAFAACPADGAEYANLSEGPHTFEVRATDAAGNTDESPAQRHWTVDVTPPAVIEPTHPTDGATGVAVDTKVRAGFSEEMAASSIGTSSVTLTASTGNAVSGSVTYDATSRTATFTPAAPLPGSSSYTATITTAVRDVAGNGLAAEQAWSFTTSAAPDTTAPETSITSGPSGRVNSASAGFTYASSEPDSAFACRLDGGPFADCPGGRITYSGLPDGAHTFDVTATDEAGNIDATPATRTWIVDVTPPQVVTTTPAAGATAVSVGTQVKARFSEEMAASSIGTSSFTLTASTGNPVSGSVTYDATSRTATFTPAAALAASSSYTATVTTAVTDLAGNALAEASSWSFTTAAAPAGLTLQLHNGPTTSGHTTAQKHMPMDQRAPTTTTLYQYSTDIYTGSGGRAVEKSSPSAAQPDAKYMANWVYRFDAATAFGGNAELRIWVAMKDLKCDKTPSFTVYLREKTASTTDAGTTLATATASSPSPGGSGPCGFRLLTVMLPLSGTDVAAGNWMELKVEVNESTGDTALLAYDTVTYAATLRLP